MSAGSGIGGPSRAALMAALVTGLAFPLESRLEVSETAQKPKRKFTDARIAAANTKRLRKQQKRLSAKVARRYE